jgi:hypothetical protein
METEKVKHSLMEQEIGDEVNNFSMDLQFS